MARPGGQPGASAARDQGKPIVCGTGMAPARLGEKYCTWRRGLQESIPSAGYPSFPRLFQPWHSQKIACDAHPATSVWQEISKKLSSSANLVPAGSNRPVATRTNLQIVGFPLIVGDLRGCC